MKKILSLFLCVLLLLTCLIGCANKEEDNTDTNDTVSTNGEVDDFPDIPKQDNGGLEFNILYPKWQLYDGSYYFADGMYGDVVGDQSYQRMLFIEEHLGIKIVPILTTNDAFNGVLDVMNQVRISGMVGDDNYQMALSHCFNGITAVATGGFLTDFQDVPNIDLEAEYWRKSQMEQVAIDGGLYFGSGSFIIPDPCVMLFNKEIVNSFTGLSADDLYQSVRDKKWTLEKMKQYASAVNTEGSYGFVTVGDWEMIAFMAAEGYYTTTQKSDGTYELLNFNEKIDNICRVVDTLYEAEYSSSLTQEDKNNAISTGKAMFSTSGLSSCISVVSSSSSALGILPYPSVSEDVEHQNLDWSGYMVIPNMVQNKELAGAVAELLCYYGEKNIYPAFYDKLLGSRTAKNLEDAEMLDLIFDTVVHDPGLTFSDGAQTNLGYILYAIPKTVEPDGGVEVSSYFEKYYSSAAQQLKEIKVE